MLREPAACERAPDRAGATEEQVRGALLGEHPAVFAPIAEDDDGETVGSALWFLDFSTWTGTRGVHPEDLRVRPAARGAGHAGESCRPNSSASARSGVTNASGGGY